MDFELFWKSPGLDLELFKVPGFYLDLFKAPGLDLQSFGPHNVSAYALQEMTLD